jgi:hypothetical protein
MPREPDLNRAEELVISIRLLRKAELQSLFPVQAFGLKNIGGSQNLWW